MADVMPNYHVSIQRIKATIAGLHHNIERAKLELMEIEDRRVRQIENMNATRGAIAEQEASLKSLLDEHGEPPEVNDG